jgi:hypothetical protein
VRRIPRPVRAAALAAALLTAATPPIDGVAACATEEGAIAIESLTGRWVKATTDPCAARYPAELVLRPGGLYEAPGGPEAGAVWHSGEWRLEDTALIIQMADDEMRPYGLEASDSDELAITDVEGCRIVYRRAPAGAEGQG